MNLYICPECSAAVANITKHALTHTTYPQGEWVKIDMMTDLKEEIGVGLNDKTSN